MEIKYYGQACFSIEDKGIKVITDPYSESIGLKLPKLSSDVITVSHDAEAYNNVTAVEGEPRVFSWPGEYETKGVHFKAIHSFHNPEDDKEQLENNIFLMHFNGIKLCHLGAQGRALSTEQLEQIGDVDVLFVPVGGKTVLSAKKSKKVIEQIEPRIIIPMIYASEGHTIELEPLSAFMQEMGSTPPETVDSFKFKKSDLPDENSKIVLLNLQ